MFIKIYEKRVIYEKIYTYARGIGYGAGSNISDGNLYIITQIFCRLPAGTA